MPSNRGIQSAMSLKQIAELTGKWPWLFYGVKDLLLARINVTLNLAFIDLNVGFFMAVKHLGLRNWIVKFYDLCSSFL